MGDPRPLAPLLPYGTREAARRGSTKGAAMVAGRMRGAALGTREAGRSGPTEGAPTAAGQRGRRGPRAGPGAGGRRSRAAARQG